MLEDMSRLIEQQQQHKKHKQQSVKEEEEVVGMNKKPCMMCVHCATPVDAVYVEYSPGNIRLSVCAKCEHTADEYVECEMMIVLIDLVLQKSKAYRHIFFNYPLLHKLSMRVHMSTAGVDIHFDSQSTGEIWQVVAKVALVDNLSLLTVLVVSHILLKRVAYSKTVWTDIRMALVLSSYFKLFVFAMMVWEFSPLMAFIIDMLVLSSNTVAIKVMLNTSMPIAATATAAGALVRIIMGALLKLLI
ncbi:unnamed protein product [Sphagnum jensenii]|uniref:Protein ARV n=1 Tax=Sphagnum jensenii TaxID=128206 RepID=A0ABP0WYK7_9BRYO